MSFQRTNPQPGTTTAQLPGGGSVTVDGAGEDVDEFVEDLIESMTVPIRDRDSAAAVVPIVIRAPGAYIDKIKHISFATPLDAKADAMLDRNIRRLALTMDLPPEQLLGMADVNHWTAWQIDESSIKLHVEPPLELITSGLTERWLYPAVEAQGAPVNRARRINYDVTELRQRPDRSAEAFQLWDRLLLSDEALVREVGLDPADMPDPVEVVARLIRRVAAGTTTPELVAAALAKLGAALDPAPAGDGTPVDQPDDGTGTEVEVPVEDRRELPQAASAVLCAAGLLVDRAVERAHNRVNRRGSIRRPIPGDQLDAALEGAWKNAPAVARQLRLDPDAFTAALDRYTRALLTEGLAHSEATLATVLARTRVLALGTGRG